MGENKIDYYAKESRNFKPLKHFSSCIQEMENKSNYGLKLLLSGMKLSIGPLRMKFIQ